MICFAIPIPCKTCILCATYSLCDTYSLLGPSVYIVLPRQQLWILNFYNIQATDNTRNDKSWKENVRIIEWHSLYFMFFFWLLSFLFICLNYFLILRPSLATSSHILRTKRHYCIKKYSKNYLSHKYMHIIFAFVEDTFSNTIA